MASAPKPVAAPQFKIKQRKRNAVHKYEPDQFKANLIALLPADTLDLEKYYSVLETNEAKIDIKRYAEPFFEIFIVGDLLAPGGVIANVENSFCIFSAQESIESIKPVVQIVERLSRRYKYLPVKLDETLAHLLQYINKFGENSNKLAIAVALFVTSGLAPASVMHQLLKEHLVKDRLALDFFVLFLQTCLHELTLDQVTTIIRKNGLDAKIPDFFPQSDRQEELVAAHMESVGLSEVYAFYLKQQSTVIKDQTFQTLIQMFTESTPALVLLFSLR